jgi:hypothetical protein
MQATIPFADIRRLQPEEFVDVLVNVLDVKGVVVGANYRFGVPSHNPTIPHTNPAGIRATWKLSTYCESCESIASLGSMWHSPRPSSVSRVSTGHCRERMYAQRLRWMQGIKPKEMQNCCIERAQRGVYW